MAWKALEKGRGISQTSGPMITFGTVTRTGGTVDRVIRFNAAACRLLEGPTNKVVVFLEEDGTAIAVRAAFTGEDKHIYSLSNLMIRVGRVEAQIGRPLPTEGHVTGEVDDDGLLVFVLPQA